MVKMKKVLFIDDDESLVKVMEKIFVVKSFDFSFAYDGETGIQKAVEMRPDIIILDISLPGIDGYEACRMIRSNEEIRKIPVIFISGRYTGGYMCEDNIMEVVESGADDFILKPFDMDELLTRIDTVLRVHSSECFN